MALSMILTILSGVLSAAGAVLGVAARNQKINESEIETKRTRLEIDRQYRQEVLDQTIVYLKGSTAEENNVEEKES